MRVLCLALILSFSFSSQAGEPTSLFFTKECILKAVLKRKGFEYRADIPLPQVFVASQISLEQFQDAVEPQIGMRPEMVLNFYIAKLNQIYLLDDSDYYNKVKRTMDDSLAHEFTHYVQVKYQNFPLMDDDSLESDAVSVQTWFRETFMDPSPRVSPCQLH